MSPDNRLFADNTRGVKDINNTHLIISGGITNYLKHQEYLDILTYLSYEYR